MDDGEHTTDQLMQELAQLRQQVADLQSAQAEREKGERELRQIIHHLREAQQLAHIGSWEWNIERGNLTWSDEVFRIFGLQPGEFEPSVEAFEATIHPEDRDEFLCQRNQMLHEKQTACLDHRILLPDGTVRTVQERARVELDEQGTVCRVIGTVQDITERTLIEDALLESEERYRALFEGSPDAIYLADPENGEIVDANPAAEHLLLLPRVDLIGMHQTQLHPPDMNAIVREYFVEQVRQSESSRQLEPIETAVIRSDGVRVSVEVHSHMISIGGKLILQGVFHDLTALKHAEQMLQEWALFARFNPAPILRFDTNGIIRLANLAACEILKHPSLENMRLYDIFPNIPSESFIKTIHRGTILTFEAHLSEGYYHFVVKGVQKLEIGQIYGMNITDRKRAEDELKRAKETAEASSRAKSLFLANMSHELRTPLNAILEYAHLLRQDSALSDPIHRAAEIIYSSGEHLLDMINDVLDLTRLEAHKIDPVPVVFHLPDLLQALLDMQHIAAQQNGLSLHDENRSDLPVFVYGERKFLRQILLNLLSNAIKFTEPGGHVILRVRMVDDVDEFTDSPTHQLTSSNTQKLTHSTIRFEVEDSGIGIAPEALLRLFRPFEQVHDRQSHFEGTGLGLSISQKLARTMGSEIHVTSISGQGSRFWFDVELPTAAGQYTLHDVPETVQTEDDISPSIHFSMMKKPDQPALRHLRRLALRGNPKEILHALDKLSRKTPDVKPFTTYLSALMSEFRIDRIRTLLQCDMEE